DKYQLASRLADFLASFHTIGWLHENFHSNNVFYFNSSVDEGNISVAQSGILREPHIVGLNKSRPGSNAWHTEGPLPDSDYQEYQHPQYQKTKRFRIGYDYFSLGMVLLEIGLWTPISTWTKSSKERMLLDPSKLRDLLVDRCLPRLGPRMGREYQKIVRLLLTDELDPHPEMPNPDPQSEHSAFDEFIKRVVEPLARRASVYAEV
ncbi:hypothetical protein B0T24DRAFT_689902, partial [Lasiosphaeria ovina]